jgi:uncharacterized phage-associated protein
MTAKYTAAQIADWFLARNRMDIAELDGEAISNMKLQKLLYYAQGAYLAIVGKPLFSDPIVAWKHGPVIETLYHKYKEFGSNGIYLNECALPDLDEETENILEQVYQIFGQYSAWKLREMTHNEAPWNTTEQGCEIDAAKIKDYFVRNHIVE